MDRTRPYAGNRIAKIYIPKKFTVKMSASATASAGDMSLSHRNAYDLKYNLTSGVQSMRNIPKVKDIAPKLQ